MGATWACCRLAYPTSLTHTHTHIYHALLNEAPASSPITYTCACQVLQDNAITVLHKLCCPLPPNHVHRPHLDCCKNGYRNRTLLPSLHAKIFIS